MVTCRNTCRNSGQTMRKSDRAHLIASVPDGWMVLPLATLVGLIAPFDKAGALKGVRIHLTPDAVVCWRGPRKGGILSGADALGLPVLPLDAEAWIRQGDPYDFHAAQDPAFPADVLASVLSARLVKRSERVRLRIDRVPKGAMITLQDDADRPRWS